MDISVLVNSCDKYEKIWPVFFDMFKRFWPDCKYRVYLNTESKDYIREDMEIYMLHSQKSTWSARLIECLARINTEYVITILDDFILEEPVNSEMLEQCLMHLSETPAIGMLQFTVGTGDNKKIAPYREWKEQLAGERYRINCQIAIWKKSYLLKILRPFESPWEFERYGSIRSRRYSEKVYAWSTEENYVFTYNWGKPIIGGKWNLDEVDRLEAKLNIKFDLSGREGMRNYYDELKNKPKPTKNLAWFIEKVKHIRSLL